MKYTINPRMFVRGDTKVRIQAVDGVTGRPIGAICRQSAWSCGVIVVQDSYLPVIQPIETFVVVTRVKP